MRWRWNVIALGIALFAVGFVLGVTTGSNAVVAAVSQHFQP